MLYFSYRDSQKTQIIAKSWQFYICNILLQQQKDKKQILQAKIEIKDKEENTLA
jgi:hypothetical protein